METNKSTTATAVTVTGAKKIRVTSAIPTWLQIAELQAIEAITGKNVALASNGATAVGSSNYAGTNPGKAIDGICPAKYPDIFHSNGPGAAEFLEITLDQPANLASLTLYGRVDFSSRDSYNITIFNSEGATLFSGQLDNRELEGGGKTLTFDVALPPASEVTVEVQGQKFTIVTVFGNFRAHAEKLKSDPWYNNAGLSEDLARAVKATLGITNQIGTANNMAPGFANKYTSISYRDDGNTYVNVACWVATSQESGGHATNSQQVPMDWSNNSIWATLKGTP
jgi:hypothetical protein